MLCHVCFNSNLAHKHCYIFINVISREFFFIIDRRIILFSLMCDVYLRGGECFCIAVFYFFFRLKKHHVDA